MSPFLSLCSLLFPLQSLSANVDLTQSEGAEEINCESNPKVICIGLGTYGQSLCRQAIFSNLTVVDVFDDRSTASQPISALLSIDPDSRNCFHDLTTSQIDALPQRLPHSDPDSTKMTALIALSSTLDSLDSAVEIISHCLSSSINVVSIMTPQLSPFTVHKADSATRSLFNRIHRLAIDHKVRFRARGLTNFLRSTLIDAQAFKSWVDGPGHEELVGRVQCDA